MASMEKIAPSANRLKQFQAMRLASRPFLYRCNDKRVCHHQRKTRTELSLKSTGTLPNAKRQKEARGRKPKKSRSASRNTQQTFAIFLDCTVETPSQELASMKRSALGTFEAEKVSPSPYFSTSENICLKDSQGRILEK